MCGLRTRPRTDVDPPRVELSSADGEHIVSPPRGDNLLNSLIRPFFYMAVLFCYYFYSVPDRGPECVCLSVCVCPRSYLRNYTSDLHRFFLHVTYDCGSVLWRRSDVLCTSGFMDDVIFAHKPMLLDVAAQLKRSTHASLGLAINCAQ